MNKNKLYWIIGIVVLIVFRKDILALAKGVLNQDKLALRFLLWLAIASVPIALAGFFLNSTVKSAFSNLRIVGFSLLITSLMLFLSKYPKKKAKRLSAKSTFVIGLAQAIAILPGVSRSGATISAGLMQGVKREEAARFSFLLFIPAILGAAVYELKNISQVSGITALLLGTLASVITGLFSLRLLLRIIKKGKLSYFGWYCLALGIVVIVVAYV